ncbi:MAG: hypothetical protein Kow0099_11980 [Candidatus Abyssubacteria bacterium]
MKCAKARLLMLDLLYDEIRPRKRAALEKHLEKCEACSAEMAAHEATISTFGALSPEEPPAELTHKVVAMAEQSAKRHRRVAAPYWKPALAAAAAAALVVVSVVYYFPQAQKEQTHKERIAESGRIAMKLEKPGVKGLESATPAEARHVDVAEAPEQMIQRGALDEDLSHERKDLMQEMKPAAPEMSQPIVHDGRLRRQVESDKGNGETGMTFSAHAGARAAGEEHIGEVALSDQAIEEAPLPESAEGDASMSGAGAADELRQAPEPTVFRTPAKTKMARSGLSRENETAAPPPDDIMASARFLLGQSYQEKDDCEEAVAIYEKIIREHPEFSKIGEVHLAAGDCYLSMGKTDEALRHFQIVRDTQPDLRDTAVEKLELIQSPAPDK